MKLTVTCRTPPAADTLAGADGADDTCTAENRNVVPRHGLRGARCASSPIAVDATGAATVPLIVRVASS